MPTRTHPIQLCTLGPSGLEPFCELDRDRLEILTLQARLLGLGLSEWLETIIAVGLDEGLQRDPPHYLDVRPPLLEIALSPEITRRLVARLWSDLDTYTHYGEVASDHLYFAAWPGNALLTEKLAAKGVTPRRVVQALFRASERRMDLDPAEAARAIARQWAAYERRREELLNRVA